MTAAAFITGIGGQDGTYLAERLLADGMEVHALVLEADGHPAHCPDEVVLHTGDLGDIEATRRLVAEIAPREVYNLAAISSVAQSWEEPDRTAHVNGLAAVALMESAREVDGVRLVQASSAEIFGDAAESFLPEKNPVFSHEDNRSFVVSTRDASHFVFVKSGSTFKFTAYIVEP